MVDIVSPFVPKAGSVAVALVATDGVNMVRITIYSQVKPGAAMRRDTRFADMESFKGGPDAAVGVVSGYIAEEMCAKYGDQFDPETMARTGINAFKDVMMKVDLEGFGKKLIEVDEDRAVATDFNQSIEEQ